MKALILALTLVVCYMTNSFSQPTEIKSNTFLGHDKKIDTAGEFETENWIYFTKEKTKIKNLQFKETELLEKIKRETHSAKEKELNEELVKNRKDIRNLEMRKDSLYNEYMKDFLEIQRFTAGFKQPRSRALFDLIYEGDDSKRFSFLTNSGFNIGDNTGSLYTELVSGQMSVFRVSLGTMIASSSSTDSLKSNQEEAFQRLSTYGGNTVLTLEYPLIYAHTRNNDGLFLARIISKGTADFPALGTTTDSWAGSLSLGLDLYGDIATSNNKIRFFGNFNYNRFYGSSAFQENLGINNDWFSFGQLKLGITFSNVSLSFIVITYSSEATLRNKNVIAGGRVVHN